MNRPTPQPYHADDQRQRHRELARHQHPAQTSALGAAASCFSQRVMDAHAPAGQDDAEGAAEHGEHQDHCMDDGEDRRGRADAERQREDDDRRRAGGAAQRPEGEADVFESVGLDRV